MANALISALCSLLALTALPVAAQTLPDPTRPPMTAPESTGAAGAAGTEAAVVTGPVLQSVILRPGAKPVALIGGEWVTLGGTYAGAKLIKVTDSAVVLKGPNGTETLKMTPAAAKATAPAIKSSDKQVKKTGSNP